MKPMRMSLVLLLLIFSVAPLAKSAAQVPSSHGQSSQTPLPPTLAADVDREISAVEKQVWMRLRPCRRRSSTFRLRR